jgi:hypothetical protein
VVNTYVGGTVRRKLGERWDAVLSGGYARNNGFAVGQVQNDYQTQTGDVGLEHSLTQKVRVRFGYNYLRQLSSESSVGLANFDRNLWYVRLAYGFGEVPLGR